MELTIQRVLLIVLIFASIVTGQNSCISLPCKNGGTCYPGEISYQCVCINGYTGQNCTELTFQASIGIYDVNTYLPVILGEGRDMTEYNAQRLRRRISFTFALRSQDIRSTFNWTLNGTVLELANWRFRVDNILGSLTIYFTTLADEGVYQVFVSNEFGKLLGRKIPLKFAVTGDFLSPNTPINLTMIEGEPFLLPCSPRAYSYPRVEYEWIIDATRQPIPDGFGPRILTEPNGDLLFSSVEVSDFFDFMDLLEGGMLTPLRCRARGLFLDTVLGPPVYFYVNSPSVTPSPSSPVRFYTKPQGVYTVLAGDQFYLNCTAGGRPLPEIRWYQNGAPINNSGDFFLHQKFNRTLRLGSLNPWIHDGFYACEAVSNNRRITATFQVKILGKVNALYEVTGEELEYRAGEYGGRVKMYCNMSGHPIIKRTWYYNGVELKYSARFLNRWSVDPNGTLEISHLRLKDFGFFQCFAENLLSQGDRRIYLVVTGAPLPPTNVQVTNCANHTTNITWELRLPSDILPTGFIVEWRSMRVGHSLNQGQLPSFSKLVKIPGGLSRSYEVNDLKPWNEIQFRVRAENSLGYGFPGRIVDGCVTSSKAPFLFPTDLRLTFYPGDGVIGLIWTPLEEVDWSGPNCVYRLFYRQNASSSPWNNVTITSCDRSDRTLFGLLPNTEYEISIRAENSVGAGPSSPTIRVRSRQARVLPPENVTIVRVDSSSVELEWSAIQVLFPKTVDGYVILAAPGSLTQINDEQDQLRSRRSLKRRKRSFSLAGVLIGRAFPNNTIVVDVNTSLRGVVTGLKPWTTYLVVVAGYNNAGLGNPQRLSVTTLDSKDSYFLLSMRILSEDFTEDLKDRSSSKFINLERHLTTELSSLYQKEIWFKKASLLTLRPGSVIADVQLEAASPNASVVLDVVSGMNTWETFHWIGMKQR
ncbi:fibronectin type III domain-containing protein-like [Montipora foliosa]|uniref:fibronectin type III domain-containing protein-like n=1 Tax=Montipora foliosa TaxID=591990 RepID=UPI0035F1B383